MKLTLEDAKGQWFYDLVSDFKKEFEVLWFPEDKEYQDMKNPFMHLYFDADGYGHETELCVYRLPNDIVFIYFNTLISDQFIVKVKCYESDFNADRCLDFFRKLSNID